MDDIILSQPWGGLGDNLQLTVIPELCKAHNIKCFLSNHNAYRNPGIHDFVWKDNKNISGYTDEPAEFQHTLINPKHNIVQAVQLGYGFEPITEYPVVDYVPNKIDEYKNKTLIDFSACSIREQYNFDNLNSIITNYNLSHQETLVVTHSTMPAYSILDKTLDSFECIDVTDLYTYSDILYSCKKFITLFSGQSVLASTIKNKMNTDMEIDVLLCPMHGDPNFFHPDHNIGYTFSNTNYIVTEV